MIRPEFEVHMLNDQGKLYTGQIAEAVSQCLDSLEAICGNQGREMALVRTHLELGNYYAKRAMASQTANQQPK